MHIESPLDGPDFLEAVADAEAANDNHINAAEFRRRARQWRSERAQAENTTVSREQPAMRIRRASELPAHHFTPTDHR